MGSYGDAVVSEGAAVVVLKEGGLCCVLCLVLVLTLPCVLPATASGKKVAKA